MNWEDERYVRLYTRDSTTWLKWTWEARAVFALMLRKVDRAGRLPLDGETPADAVALHTGLPVDVVERGLAQITRPGKDGCSTAVVGSDTIQMPNFEVAQTVRSSDAKRAKEYRDRRGVTKSDDPSQNVTETGDAVTGRHTPSPVVTNRHSSGAVLSGAGRGGTEKQESPPAPQGGDGLALVPPAARRPAALNEGARRVLDEVNRQRQRVIPGASALGATPENLRRITERLAANSLDDCLHVVAVVAAGVEADPSTGQWFDAITPFRPDNFARNLARQVARSPPEIATEYQPCTATPEEIAAYEERDRIQGLEFLAGRRSLP